MTPDWPLLRAELALWRADGRVLPLWWRDDDAVSHTPALDRLARVSRDLALPVHIAVIPEPASAGLADAVAAEPGLIPLVHGWAHRNHADKGGKKAEFGAPRPGAAKALGRGRVRLQSLFGARLVPVFVPPWNRIDARYLPALVAAGYGGVSTFAPRGAEWPVPGLAQINTHLDPIDWRGTRGLVEADVLIARLVAILADRRTGKTDAKEPLGYLTHHLVHDAALWEFSRALLSELLSGGALPVQLPEVLELPAPPVL